MSRGNEHRSNRKQPDLPPYQHVKTWSEWRSCLKRLQEEGRVALDLESNSMYAYQEQVCLVQISIPGQDYIVDPLGDFSLSGLGAIIEDGAVEKVFHAAEYDLILMKREYGWELENLFDTMWAARILGYERVGLANILGEFFGVKLNKRYQRANWCKRPLSAKQLAYAQADTHYLLALRERFARELDEADRTNEAAEIFAEQSTVDLPSNEFDPDSFWSINGVNRLPADGKAILKALHVYRDEQAERRDRPHFKVLQDKTLLELVRRRPRNNRELRKVHGMTSGQIRRYGDDVLRIIREKRGAPAPRRPRRKPRPPEDVVNRYERLHAWRKERGRQRGVESDVIVSRDTLWALAHANPQTRAELEEIGGLGPWRLQSYGDEILRVLAR